MLYSFCVFSSSSWHLRRETAQLHPGGGRKLFKCYRLSSYTAYLHVIDRLDRFQLPNCAHVLDNVIRSSTASIKLWVYAYYNYLFFDDLCGAHSRTGGGEEGRVPVGNLVPRFHSHEYIMPVMPSSSGSVRLARSCLHPAMSHPIHGAHQQLLPSALFRPCL